MRTLTFAPMILGVRLKIDHPDVKKRLKKVMSKPCSPLELDGACPGLFDTAVHAMREFNQAGTRVDNFMLKGRDELVLVAEDNSITMRRTLYKIPAASAES